jgi:hypothetical protein
MFNATAQMNIAKIRRNFAASNLCAKRTPKGETGISACKPQKTQ